MDTNYCCRYIYMYARVKPVHHHSNTAAAAAAEIEGTGDHLMGIAHAMYETTIVKS